MRAAGILLLAALALAGSAARADVFEVGDDGAVRTRGSTGAVVWSGGASDDPAESGFVEGTPDVPAGALTLVSLPEAPAAFHDALMTASRRYEVSPSLLAALVWRESRWQPAALSSKGAIGLAQLMPATARALAVDPRDAGANLAGAAHYLRQMLDLFDGDVERALAAYNAGPARVLRANGIPAITETRSYVSAIIDRLATHRSDPSNGEAR